MSSVTDVARSTSAALSASLAARLHTARAEIELRAERKDDLDFMRGIYAAVRADELALTDWPDERKKLFTDSQFDLQHAHYQAHYPGAEFLVVLCGGEPVGRLYLCVLKTEIRVMDIALTQALRGRGIGSALMAALIEEGRMRGLALTLHVEPLNPAQRLYRRLGFQLIERRGVYDFLGWSPEGRRIS